MTERKEDKSQCINFVNLRTAQARTRFKEISLNKIIGATKKTLIIEYGLESILLSIIAMVAASIVAYSFLPYLF